MHHNVLSRASIRYGFRLPRCMHKTHENDNYYKSSMYLKVIFSFHPLFTSFRISFKKIERKGLVDKNIYARSSQVICLRSRCHISCTTRHLESWRRKCAHKIDPNLHTADLSDTFKLSRDLYIMQFFFHITYNDIVFYKMK